MRSFWLFTPLPRPRSRPPPCQTGNGRRAMIVAHGKTSISDDAKPPDQRDRGRSRLVCVKRVSAVTSAGGGRGATQLGGAHHLSPTAAIIPPSTISAASSHWRKLQHQPAPHSPPSIIYRSVNSNQNGRAVGHGAAVGPRGILIPLLNLTYRFLFRSIIEAPQVAVRRACGRGASLLARS